MDTNKKTSQKEELKSAWREFQEGTVIHGFAEYGSMKSRFLQVAWICVCVCVALCCGLLLTDIADAFASKKPITSVRMVKYAQMPSLAIRFGYDVQRVLGELATPDLHHIKHAVIAQAIHRVPCPSISNDTTGSVNWTQVKNVYHGSSELARFTKEYEALMPPLEYYTINEGARIVTGHYSGHSSTPDFFQSLTKLRLTAYGPIWQLDMRDLTTGEITGINIWANVSYDYAILVGNEVKLVGPTKGKILNPYSHYTLILQLREVRYSKRFCDESYSRFDCQTTCALKKAKQNHTICVPYLGDDPEAAGTRVCSGSDIDQKICEATMSECLRKCQKCVFCRHCEQVTGEWRILKEDQLNPANNDLSLGFAVEVDIRLSDDEIIQYYTTEMFSLAAFVSQLGGIMGLGFGISIISLFHLLCAAGKAAASLIKGKRTVCGG